MPEFDAPHRQPEQPAPSPEKTARRVPVAMILVAVITAAAVALGVALFWVSTSG